MKIDAHTHVFRFGDTTSPQPPQGAVYAPPVCDERDHRAHLEEIGCTHAVIVQPSVYGTEDHGVLLNALGNDRERLRGIACVAPDVADGVLEEMARKGVVGTRVQDEFPGGVRVGDIRAVAARVGGLGWHLEVWSDLRKHRHWFAETVGDLDVDVVIDHLGYMPSDVALTDPAMTWLLDLLTLDNVWITLSGADRLFPADGRERTSTTLADHRSALTDRVQAFVDIAPDRVLWGSDWPHVGVADPPPSDDLRRRWEEWVPAARDRDRIGSLNNARRYGFEIST